MATLQQLEAALRAADAAGNTDDAKRLAQAYAAARGQQTAPEKTLAQRYADAGIDPTEGTDPTEGNSFLQNAMEGLGKSFADTGHGLAQLGTDAARYFVEANPMLFGGRSVGSLVSGKDDSLAGRLRAKVQQQQAEEADRRKRDAPLMHTGGGVTGEVAGTLAQILGPGIALRGTSAAASLLPRTVLGNAVQGAMPCKAA
jgi:hypothetical protein